MILLPGVLGFALFILFDLNKIKWQAKVCNLFFPLGGLLLLASTALCIAESSPVWSIGTVIGSAAVIAACGALIYALFFALPFQDTYAESHELPVVTTGLYGLCRHPAFWPMLLVYLLLWLTFGGTWMAVAAVLYPLCNLFYIVIQDRWIFPCYIRGYDAYKKQVPFLIPRRK